MTVSRLNTLLTLGISSAKPILMIPCASHYIAAIIEMSRRKNLEVGIDVFTPSYDKGMHEDILAEKIPNVIQEHETMGKELIETIQRFPRKVQKFVPHIINEIN